MTNSEFVPLDQWSDDRIREVFIDDGGRAEYYDPIDGAREQRRIAGKIFDEWLAAHDAEVAARALRDAATGVGGFYPADLWPDPSAEQNEALHVFAKSIGLPDGSRFHVAGIRHALKLIRGVADDIETEASA